VLRNLVFLVCLLFLGGVDVSGAQATARVDSVDAIREKRWGTWSAATSTGRTAMGTWTGTPDSTGRAVTGTWTLNDTQGRVVMSGGWSAAKAATQWNGAWRAKAVDRAEEYSGTWTSTVELKGDATFADLFEKAVQSVVSGSWRAGTQSGAWSIRTGKREGSP
jgi:hypothetical protein